MFKDYDKAKSMLRGSFEHILGLMDKRYVTYDEVKDLMVEALYKLSKENEKVETKTVTMPQVLYGPPPVEKTEEVVVERVEVPPQILYGPPPMREIHEVKMPQVLYGPPPIRKEERVVPPQILYGPPPIREFREVKMPQVLYGPPPMDRRESRGEMVDMFDDGFIPGTNVPRPRGRKMGESEDEYLAYLESYYAAYLPGEKGKGPRK